MSQDIRRTRWWCWACRKKFITYTYRYEKQINECPFCHAGKERLTDMDLKYYHHFPNWEEAKADMDELLKDNLHMQPIENIIVIENDRPSYEERQYMIKRKEELGIVDPPKPEPITTMPSGVKYKSNEYYLYHSYKNEGYGCLVVMLCLLAILCGQWYMIIAILIAYVGFINKNNNDLNNSPNIQKERKSAKDVRENSNYSEEFIEKERERLGL